jgi:hypothetical protein
MPWKFLYYWNILCPKCGPGSSVGIATDYGLDGPGIESRWRRDFPPVQTGPGAHGASCTMGTGSFPWVKCGWDVLLTTHPLLVPRSAISLPTLWTTTGPVTGSFYSFTLPIVGVSSMDDYSLPSCLSTSLLIAPWEQIVNWQFHIKKKHFAKNSHERISRQLESLERVYVKFLNESFLSFLAHSLPLAADIRVRS